MPRTIPAGRIQKLLEAAISVFISNGYRLTQVEDVARAVGISKGSVYTYAESKEALFFAALRHAAGEPLPEISQLPLPTPKEGEAGGYVRQQLGAVRSELERVSQSTRRRPDQRLREHLHHLYSTLSAHRVIIKLVDRAAKDHPELSGLWFQEGRWEEFRALVERLKDFERSRRFQPFDSPEVAARILLETIVMWAIHRHWDASPQVVDEDEVQEQVIDFLMRSVIHRGSRRS